MYKEIQYFRRKNMEKRNYWLFQIMHDWFPNLWKAMLDNGIAAQHYPIGWINEARNIKALNEMKKGDFIIAAFKNYRFGGYGTLLSDFFRDGESLNIERENEIYEFRERFWCEWTAIPFDNNTKPYIDCKNLKEKGLKLELLRGMSVVSTDEKSFFALKKEIDYAGAINYKPEHMKNLNPSNDISEPPLRIPVTINRVIRDTTKAKKLKEMYNYKCQVCGERIEILEEVFYAEAHHIKPLGKNHDGFDEEDNMIILCPNHHAMFDFGIPYFKSDQLIRIGNKEIKLQVINTHKINQVNIRYYNEKIHGKAKVH